MLDSALASRAYTADEIDPLLVGHMQDGFPPQSIPFYAATQTFASLRKLHPDFTYKEATLNPTNPRDRATDWEADIIEQFRNHPGAQQIEGERATPVGRSLYLARPIRARPECLSCHGLASAAPAALITRYGRDNGFGWQANEVIGAQIVSVPFADAVEGARRLFSGITLVIVVVLLALLAIINVTVYWGVVHPLRQMARQADEVSLGRAAGSAFASGRNDEIGALGEAFERMRKSLNKAMQLIGGPTRGA
jgi:protein-histidine pros-kinase